MSADIGKSVRDRIRSRTAVTNIVGANIFADVLDQGAKPPAVVVVVAGNSPEHDLAGTNRLFASQITVLSYGRHRDEANDIAKQVRDDALPANLRGSIEGMEWVEVTLMSGPEENVQAPQDASDNWIRITSQEFVIWNSAV